MRKVFVVIKTKTFDDQAATQAVAVFQNEGDAQTSAQKWTSSDTHAWVDEVNYYE